MQQRRFRLLVAYAVLLLPTVVFEASHALKGTVNSPLEWPSPNDPTRERYEEFVETFGSGDIVIASWAGCEVRSPQLDELTSTLRTDAAFFDGSAWLFDQVTTGRELVRQMVRSGLSAAEAIEQVQGTLIGPDGSTTCVVVGFAKDAVALRGKLVPLIQQAIETTCGVPAADQHLAGPVIDGLSVDTASAATLQTLAPMSSLVVFIVAILCLGSWREAVIVFAVSLYCQGVTFALVSVAGDSVSALLVVLPPLIQVLALAGGVHLVNYYRDAASGLSPRAAADRAVQIGWLPCVLSAATTAIGMASLMVSQLTPIRSFGAFSAAGVLMTTAILLVLVPNLLVMLQNSGCVACSAKAHRTGRIWKPLASILAFANVPFVIAFTMLMLVASAGASKLHTSVRIETLFNPGTRILSDYRWLEAHVGPLVPIEVTVGFASDGTRSNRQQLAITRYVDNHLASRPKVGGTLSAATFLPTFSQPQPGADPVQAQSVARAEERAVANAIPRLTQMRLVATTRSGARQWRVRAFVSAGGDLDYAELLHEIESDLSAALVDQHGNALAGVTVQTTGIMPLVHCIQHQLMDDLRNSFLLAFAIILVVMTVLQGSIAGGIVVMIPNIFPTLLLFGTLGWMETPIDIGSVMTASVALGVAVDDTLHFLTAFQQAIREGRNRKSSVLLAYERCGMAMLQTSVICAVGMAVFAVSDFLPTARFAWMMVGLFTAALFGDLVLLPALLMGPLGLLFECDTQSQCVAGVEEYPASPASATISRHDHSSRAASIVNPGPNPSMIHGPHAPIVPRRSRTKATVGDDMFP